MKIRIWKTDKGFQPYFTEENVARFVGHIAALELARERRAEADESTVQVEVVRDNGEVLHCLPVL